LLTAQRSTLETVQAQVVCSGCEACAKVPVGVARLQMRLAISRNWFGAQVSPEKPDASTDDVAPRTRPGNFAPSGNFALSH